MIMESSTKATSKKAKKRATVNLFGMGLIYTMDNSLMTVSQVKDILNLLDY